MVFAQRERVVSNLARFVMIIWLKGFKTMEEIDEALSKGSANGGIAAVVDETPNMKLFVAKFCSKYTMIGPIFETAGFAFVFPKRSPLLSDVSQAVLNVTEGEVILNIENKWFKKGDNCEDNPTQELSNNSLGLDSFWGLFLISGVASILSLIIFVASFLYRHKHILKHPPDSKALTWRKIRSMFEIFNERDFNSRMFKSSQQRDVIAGNPDNIAGDANSPNNNWPESTSSFSSNHTDANFEFFVGQQTQSPGQASPEIVPSTTDPAIIIAEMRTTSATAQDNN
ncbi:unnamed protein product [Prunus armeniaca]|uniref:Ionotropic glutamate receptor C-terminal domain-containing protein n=1 Tax=Prunus armeniaca TaxID=36596 RepID=A0A6J5TRV0_PRUAR|nr:unnamed protein product [Prunus armeniaca]